MKILSLITSKKYVIYAKHELVLMVIKKYHKARYHCYYTRKHRGTTHSICNLRYKT